jgi:hypothetical protein
MFCLTFLGNAEVTSLSLYDGYLLFRRDGWSFDWGRCLDCLSGGGELAYLEVLLESLMVELGLLGCEIRGYDFLWEEKMLGISMSYCFCYWFSSYYYSLSSYFVGYICLTIIRMKIYWGIFG